MKKMRDFLEDLTVALCSTKQAQLEARTLFCCCCNVGFFKQIL